MRQPQPSEATMARPRRNVPREPNGRPSRSSAITHWQRELDALRAASRDSRLGTPLGILLRAERITLRQFEAGTWFADARSAADRALGLPARSCRAQDMNAVHGASNAQDDEATATAKRKAIEAYDKASAFVGLGSKALAALELVVVYERRPDTYEQVLALIDGLDKLTQYRGMRRAA